MNTRADMELAPFPRGKAYSMCQVGTSSGVLLVFHSSRPNLKKCDPAKSTHTHIHTYIYIYIDVCIISTCIRTCFCGGYGAQFGERRLSVKLQQLVAARMCGAQLSGRGG